MPALVTVIDCVLQLLVPWIVLVFNIVHIPLTALRLIKARESGKLLSVSKFKAEWFSNFWSTIGPSVKSSYEADVTALLEGRILQGKVHDTIVSNPVSGVVLEIGPGPGTWVDILAAIANRHEVAASPSSSTDGRVPPPDCHAINGQISDAKTCPPAKSSTASDTRITKIFGIEPNLVFATTLRMRVAELNLSCLYEIVPLGIEQMLRSPDWQDRVREGTVDSIICICCLCSIPNAEENMRLLHRLLKPGGKWYIHEHVRATRGGSFMRAYQSKSSAN